MVKFVRKYYSLIDSKLNTKNSHLEIKYAYFKALLNYNYQVGSAYGVDETKLKKTQVIKKAYSNLSDKKLKEEYDNATPDKQKLLEQEILDEFKIENFLDRVKKIFNFNISDKSSLKNLPEL